MNHKAKEPTAGAAGPTQQQHCPAAPLSALVTALWFGLIVGLLEIGLTFLVKPIRDPSPGLFRMNRHLLWMVPSFHLALYLAIGCVLAIAGLVRPRWSRRWSVFVLGVIGFLTLLETYPRLFVIANLMVACALALRLSARIERNSALFDRLVRLSMPALLLVTGLIAGSSYAIQVYQPRWRSTARTGATASGSNVLLIVLDTVRADRLSLHGYGRPTTPNLARIAERGIRFDRARSTSPWTLPSHASMMTGRWPHDLSTNINTPLEKTPLTLAEHLRSLNYRTAAFVANVTYAGAETGLARGFDWYEDHELSPSAILRSSALGQKVIWPLFNLDLALIHRDALMTRKPAAVINQQLLAWLDEQPNDRPFLAFLNYFDAHDPYLPPEDHVRKFSSEPGTLAEKRLLYDWFIRDKRHITPTEQSQILDAYDDCLASLDQRIGELFAELERRQILDDTMVIITSDHGEHFGEHGLYGHASSLYGEETHVPLVIIPPRKSSFREGQVVEDHVSLRDLAATISEIAPASGSSRSPFPGRSLAVHWSSSGEVQPRSSDALSSIDSPVTSTPNQGRSPVFRGAMKSIIVDDHLYIRNGDGVEELYDTRTDPQEIVNLVANEASSDILARCRLQFVETLAESRRATTIR